MTNPENRPRPSDAVIDAALEQIEREEQELLRLTQTQRRFAKEIRAAHADPHWLDEH